MPDESRERDVVIVLIGDELLAGRTRDANGHWLAGRLDSLGYRVRRIVVVPDEDAAIRAELRDALRRAPIVIACGGLGPTHDDRTTAAVAAEFGRVLVVDEPGWSRLLSRYAKRFGRVEDAPADAVAAARKMVTVPDGARALANPVGAAPGYVVEADEGRLLVFPGVPPELVAMFDREVAGVVLPAFAADAVFEVDVGLAEASFARALEEVQSDFPDVAIGSYPRSDELRVTLRFRGAEARAAAAREAVVARFRDHVLPPGQRRLNNA